MKTIDITPENALKAYNKADKQGKELLTTLLGDSFIKKAKGKIETFLDVLDYHGISLEDFNAGLTGLSLDEVAYRKIKMIVKAIRKEWEPDWDNSNQYKYYPSFDMRSGVGFSYSYCGYWDSFSNVGSRLCFPTSDMAIYAGTQFEKEYKDFLTTNQ